MAHSDHGAQYTSRAFGQRLRAAGILGSMGSIGDAFDNAMAESFFSTIQRELFDTRTIWPSREELASAIFEWTRPGTTRSAATRPSGPTARSAPSSTRTFTSQNEPTRLHTQHTQLTQPVRKNGALETHSGTLERVPDLRFCLERKTGFEPATLTLAR